MYLELSLVEKEISQYQREIGVRASKWKQREQWAQRFKKFMFWLCKDELYAVNCSIVWTSSASYQVTVQCWPRQDSEMSLYSKKSGFSGHFLLCVFSSDGISMTLISGHLCSSGELSRQDKQVEGGSRSKVNCKLWNCKGAEIQIGNCSTQLQARLYNVGQQDPEAKVWLDLKKSLFLAWQESAGGLRELTLVSMFLMTERAILWARPSTLYSLDLGSSSR